MLNKKEYEKIALLGDNHGEWAYLFKKIDSIGLTDSLLIHMGDSGAGFYNCREKDIVVLNQKFKDRGIEFAAVRGNHDDPSYFDGSVNFSNFKFLKDYTVSEINGETWQFVGGAVSVDRKAIYQGRPYRVEGSSYWRNEIFVLDKEKAQNCDVLVTHTGPPWIGPGCKGEFVESFFERDVHLKSELLAERELLQQLYDICRPKKSFLGHFHRYETNEYHGEGYTCRATLLDIDQIMEYRK